VWRKGSVLTPYWENVKFFIGISLSIGVFGVVAVESGSVKNNYQERIWKKKRLHRRGIRQPQRAGN
ncbi:TPA: hypothetical protein ACLBAQ_001538, partial [Neisseria meningitidis]